MSIPALQELCVVTIQETLFPVELLIYRVASRLVCCGFENLVEFGG